MKKIIFMLCAIVLIVTCGYTYCFAEEPTEITSSTSEQDPTPTEVPEKIATAEPNTESDAAPIEPDAEMPGDVPEEGKYHTIFTRIWEYVVTYKAEIIAVVGDAIIFIGVLILRSVFKKKTTDISSDLESVKGDASGTRSQQVLVTDAINGLIGGYNEMRDSYDKYETVEDDRNRLVAAVMVQNTAILDILLTVYVNSKNLPQGVKDVVTLKYANTLKTLNNDEILRAVVDTVHEKVSGKVELPAPSDTSEGKA